MKNFKNIVITGLVIALGASLVFIYFTMKKGQEDQRKVSNANSALSTEATPTPTETNSEPILTGDFSYKLVVNDKNNYPPNDASYDGKIIRVDNKTKKEEVIIASIKAAYPPLKQQFNTTLMALSLPKNAKNLYFTQILMDTDASPTDIIKLDLSTKKFSKMKVSTYWQAYHPKAVLTNGALAVSTYNPTNDQDDKSLFLIDLETDTAKVFVKLASNQSFNYCVDDNCFGGFQGEVKWTNATTVQANIYNPNQTVVDESGTTTRKLLKTQNFFLEEIQ